MSDQKLSSQKPPVQVEVNHPHKHGPHCGHTAIMHEGHVDYVHSGHLHHPTSAGTVEEHAIPISATNPSVCTGGKGVGGHDPAHVHGPNCGHEAIPHGDHIDYLVDGRLHHRHNGHCDDHGPVNVVQT